MRIDLKEIKAYVKKAERNREDKKVIKDIPSKRLKEIRTVLNEIKNFGNKILGEEERGWFIGLDDIYYLFPIRTDKNKAVEIRKILDFYEDLLLKRMVNKNFLIKEFVNLFRIYHFENFSPFNIRNYFTEKVFSVMKKLMDKHIKNWSLSDEENVYYILSGYAYNTYKKIKYSRQRKEEKND